MHELLLSYAKLLLVYLLSSFRISSFNPFFSEDVSWLVGINIFSIVMFQACIVSENFSLRRKEKIKINISSFSKSGAWVRERGANRVMRWISNWETRENSERVEQRYPHTPFLFFYSQKRKNQRKPIFTIPLPDRYFTTQYLTVSTIDFLNFFAFQNFYEIIFRELG